MLRRENRTKLSTNCKMPPQNELASGEKATGH